MVLLKSLIIMIHIIPAPLKMILLGKEYHSLNNVFLDQTEFVQWLPTFSDYLLIKAGKKCFETV